MYYILGSFCSGSIGKALFTRLEFGSTKHSPTCANRRYVLLFWNPTNVLLCCFDTCRGIMSLINPFKPTFVVIVLCCIFTDALSRIVQAIFEKIPVETCKSIGISLTRYMYAYQNSCEIMSIYLHWNELQFSLNALGQDFTYRTRFSFLSNLKDYMIVLTVYFRLKSKWYSVWFITKSSVNCKTIISLSEIY